MPSDTQKSPSSNKALPKFLFTKIIPITCAAGIESTLTYPHFAAITLLQKRPSSLQSAYKRVYRKGIYHGHTNFLKFKMISRVSAFSVFQAMLACNINKSLINLSICGLLSGVIETTFTNSYTAKNRLTVMSLPHTKLSIMSMFYPNLIKNSITYGTIFNTRAYFGPIIHKKTNLSIENSYAISTALSVMALQPMTTTLDNMMTFQLKNSAQTPGLSMKDISKKSYEQAKKIPLDRCLNLMLLRTAWLGAGYFIMDRTSTALIKEANTTYPRLNFFEQTNNKPNNKTSDKSNDTSEY